MKKAIFIATLIAVATMPMLGSVIAYGHWFLIP